MDYTGERMLPNMAAPTTFWEHVERYRFACRYVRGKDVLDIACGEGYGTAAMGKAGARSVIGVDIDPQAVEHARHRYQIDARLGSAETIPVENDSVDVVISFETIEHVPNPETFLDECVRVLRPGGVLVISTPNLEVYREVTPDNPFHCSEMSVQDFKKLLGARFESTVMFGQHLPEPWFMRYRGLGRLGRICRNMLNPPRALPLTEKLRNQIVDVCLQPLPGLARYLTVEAVRPTNTVGLLKSRYVIAMATGIRA